MDEYVECIKLIIDLRTIISFLFGLIPPGVFIFFFFQKEIRLFNNLKKNIYFFKTNSNQDLTPELKKFKKAKFFKVNSDIIDLSQNMSALDVEGNSYIIIMYDKDFETKKYKEILDYAKSKGIQIFCYTRDEYIENQIHNTMFKENTYVDICNTPTRLISMVFSVAAVTPNEKK